MNKVTTAFNKVQWANVGIFSGLTTFWWIAITNMIVIVQNVA